MNTQIKYNRSMNMDIWNRLVWGMYAGLLFVACTATGYAAPMNGRAATLRQPDGTAVEVKAFGDEFYSWLETEDGYVVIRDQGTGEYTYARLSARGDEYESAGIPVGKEWAKRAEKEQKQIQKLEKKIRISRKSRKEKVERVRKALSRDEQGRIVLPDEQPVSSIQYAPIDDEATVEGVKGDAAPAAAAAASSVGGTRRGLVLLVRFPDYLADETVPVAQVDSFFNDIQYTAGGAATSVRGYFRIQSNDKLDIWNTVTPYFTAPNNRSYYEASATHHVRIQELILYRLEQLKAGGFDFSQLDGDGDGKVDCVSLLYAGGWIAGFNGWSGGMTWSGFADYGLSTSSRMQFSQLEPNPELFVVCHEFGHAICGFPDLYPYDGNAAHTLHFCLMSGGGGLHADGVSGAMKYHAGWVSAVDVTASGLSSHSLTVYGTNVIRYVNPNNPIEYFLFEMRGEVGYEGPYGGSSVEVCPSKGLVAYHVKEDGNNAYGSIFTADNPNCDYSKPPRVMVVEDNPQTAVTPWYDDMDPDEEDAFDTGDKVNGSTTPNFNFWSNSGRTIDSGIGIEGIEVGTSNLTFCIYNRNPPLITASPLVVVTNGMSTLSVEAIGMVSYVWSRVSGPGAVTFGSSNAPVTTATFGNAAGNYLLRVTMSDGVNQIVSEITIQVTAGVGEFLGNYKSLPTANNWHTGWVEVASSQLQWRNAAGVDWNLLATADPDIFLTDTTCPYGAGLEVPFLRENGQVMRFTFNGGTYTRCTPVADNISVSTTINMPVAVTLTGSDAEGEPLTYIVFANPSHGALSGSVPNLTYTPSTNYLGGDCFTFKASDGTYTSNLATVTIDVNVAPNVYAGTNQTVTLIPGTLPGIYYGTAAGNLNSTTANPKNQLLADVGSKTEDLIAENTTEIYSGQIYDGDGAISFTEHIDDKARIWIDGVPVISNDVWGTRTSTGNLNLSPGWHDIEIRISNGSGGSGPVSGIGIGYDPNGSTTWQVLVDPGDASLLRVITATASVDLDGTVSDPDGDPVYATWSKASGPGIVSFGNIYTVDTTATFYEVGTYVLRLTVDDGSGPVYDELTITVNAQTTHTSSGTPYSWLALFGITNNFEVADLSDSDGDGAMAWQEYQAGTIPTNADSVFCILSASYQGGSNELVWYGTTNSGVMSDFVIYRSEDLLSTQWVQADTFARSSDGTNIWVDPGYSGSNAFYRIEITP